MEKRALTLSEAASEYGFSRHTLRAAIDEAELPASRPLGRAYRILRVDLEAWLRSKAVKPTAHAEDVVERRLAREGLDTLSPPDHGAPA